MRPARRLARLALGVALLAPACGGREPRVPAQPPPAPLEGKVRAVAVELGPGLARTTVRALETAGALPVLRQSARDWLEQQERLAEDGSLELRIEVVFLHLRSALSTWLLSGLVRPDRLEVRVEAFRRGARVREYRLAAASALSGYVWRDPGERLRRLARRLGRRVAEGL